MRRQKKEKYFITISHNEGPDSITSCGGKCNPFPVVSPRSPKESISTNSSELASIRNGTMVPKVPILHRVPRKSRATRSADRLRKTFAKNESEKGRKGNHSDRPLMAYLYSALKAFLTDDFLLRGSARRSPIERETFRIACLTTSRKNFRGDLLFPEQKTALYWIVVGSKYT